MPATSREFGKTSLCRLILFAFERGRQKKWRLSIEFWPDLRRGGVLGLTTTHSGVKLDPLLEAIRQHLMQREQFDACAAEYNLLYDSNKEIERTIAKRHSHQDYCDMVEAGGFTIMKQEVFTYVGAVNLIRARKP